MTAAKNARDRARGEDTMKRDDKKPAAKKPQGVVKRVQLQAASAKPVQVKHLAVPPPPRVKRERIHPRRILPRVREGKERAFHSTSRDISFHMQRQPFSPAIRAATDDLAIVV